MRKINKIVGIIGIIGLVGCEKDINIDYHETPPIYVVEASVNNSLMVARLSTTKPMDDNSSRSDVNDATIIVTGNDGTSVSLKNTNNGFYRASKAGTPGVEYTIDVNIDGQHFTSTSIMQQQPVMNSFRVIRKKITSEWFQMGDLRLQDLPNEGNWYFTHIYRNNIGYRWAVTSDRNDPNKELQQFFNFFREGSDDSDVLKDGDRLHIVIRAIDQRAYDYLYSMQVMDNTGTNPIQNFTGGCLGYFSAYGGITYDYVYQSSLVEEEDDDDGE